MVRQLVQLAFKTNLKLPSRPLMHERKGGTASTLAHSPVGSAQNMPPKRNSHCLQHIPPYCNAMYVVVTSARPKTHTMRYQPVLAELSTSTPTTATAPRLPTFFTPNAIPKHN